MQVARMVHGWRKRSYPRKLAETIAALWMIARYGREAVLEVYLNLACFASGTRGAAAASHELLGHGPTHLRLFEATLLASMLTDPDMTPGQSPAFARWLRITQTRVVDALRELGEVSAEEATAALTEIAVAWEPSDSQATAPAPVES
jgi:penicillin-binding protein 1C